MGASSFRGSGEEGRVFGCMGAPVPWDAILATRRPCVRGERLVGRLAASEKCCLRRSASGEVSRPERSAGVRVPTAREDAALRADAQ